MHQCMSVPSELILFKWDRDCLEGVENYVTSNDDLMAMLIEVRDEYDQFMKLPSSLKNKLKHLSKDRTVRGGLKEVL